MIKIFALFVLCSPDLLLCNDVPHLVRAFEDADRCRAYVELTKSRHVGTGVLMGRCRPWIGR